MKIIQNRIIRIVELAAMRILIGRIVAKKVMAILSFSQHKVDWTKSDSVAINKRN